jgi:LysM repeat protein
VQFTDDYPKDKGFVHVVGKGETISSIALKYKSKIPWILSANRISDPTKVHVGKELFVPQS